MALVDELIKKGVLKNPILIEAFRVVDRKNFVANDFKEFAYIDEPLPIGEGQTISQPWTVAFMLELLDPKPGENILEIGYGSGWQTALLAAIGANVYAIERVPSLCKFGKENVKRFFKGSRDLSLLRSREPKFYCQDGTSGLPEIAKDIGSPRFGEAGEFDDIIVAAAVSAVPTNSIGTVIDLLPEVWKDRLKIGGKIVAPIGHSIFEFIKKNETIFDAVEHAGFSFVPLIKN